jgi:KaiC/GvpD/RAD55 family RecA-like ATPase
VRRLDDLLDGGLAQGAAAMLYGPPFVGKEVLARLFLLAGARKGIPGVMVLTSAAADDVRRQLAAIDKDFAEHEKRGLIRFVDAYSKTIGADDEQPNVEYVDGPMNLNGVSLGVNNAQKKIIADHAEHRLVVDSLSTLITYTNAQTTFRFMQVLVGKARRAGATTIMLMDHGMHSDPEVQTFKHLADGLVEVKTDGTSYLLKVDGLGITENRGWVEYRFTPGTFEITGSFAAGRIR